MLGIQHKEIHLGKHTIIQTGSNSWRLFISNNLHVNSVEEFQSKLQSLAESLVRYMRAEKIIPETDQIFEVYIKNENCS